MEVQNYRKPHKGEYFKSVVGCAMSKLKMSGLLTSLTWVVVEYISTLFELALRCAANNYLLDDERFVV
jgi:hypothetical protein